MKDAAVGNLAVVARSIEKGTIGLPLGDWNFLNFMSADFARTSMTNQSTSITGSGGIDRGTLGNIKYENKLKYDATTFRLLMDFVAMVGWTEAVTVLEPGLAWLVKIRPKRGNTPRGVSIYLDEGGSYTPSMTMGRRVEDLTLTDAANKRIVADITYTEPSGDTIYGAAIAKDSNSGSHDAKRIGNRGRRPYDADYTAGKSVYLQVVSSAADSAVMKAKIDTASGATDGTGFGAGAYGTFTFTVTRPGDFTDGYSVSVDSTTGNPIGLFGENNEPFEVTLGDVDLSDLTANDEFEIPYQIAKLTKTPIKENRLSSFHLVRLLGGQDVRIESGTQKFMRPYKPYYVNAKRLPLTQDPTGKLDCNSTFKKKLFDRYFREINDADARFQLYDVYKFNLPIPTTTFFEQIEIFIPQCGVETMKSGDVAGFDALEETITLGAEQPDSIPSVPNAGFEATADYPWQVNITTPFDPTGFED